MAARAKKLEAAYPPPPRMQVAAMRATGNGKWSVIAALVTIGGALASPEAGHFIGALGAAIVAGCNLFLGRY